MEFSPFGIISNSPMKLTYIDGDTLSYSDREIICNIFNMNMYRSETFLFQIKDALKIKEDVSISYVRGGAYINSKNGTVFPDIFVSQTSLSIYKIEMLPSTAATTVTTNHLNFIGEFSKIIGFIRSYEFIKNISTEEEQPATTTITTSMDSNKESYSAEFPALCV
jgi:hypothetical protein